MREKEKNTKAKFFSIFIVVIMTASVLGFFIGGGRSGEQSIEYNGYNFVRKDNGWMVLLNNRQLYFDYYPEQVSDIEVSKEIIDKFDTLEIDITNNANTTSPESIALAQYMIKQNIESTTNTYIRQGLTGENDFSLPIITCDDATQAVPVLYFKESNETKIYAENNCVMVEARTEIDFLRIKDRLLYGFFGIIK